MNREAGSALFKENALFRRIFDFVEVTEADANQTEQLRRAQIDTLS
jgi:hypothetical protein